MSSDELVYVEIKTGNADYNFQMTVTINVCNTGCNNVNLQAGVQSNFCIHFKYWSDKIIILIKDDFIKIISNMLLFRGV